MLKCIIFLPSSIDGDLSRNKNNCFWSLRSILLFLSFNLQFQVWKISKDIFIRLNKLQNKMNFSVIKIFFAENLWVICRKVLCDRISITFFNPREKWRKFPLEEKPLGKILIFKSHKFLCFWGKVEDGNYQINKKICFKSMKSSLKWNLLLHIWWGK